MRKSFLAEYRILISRIVIVPVIIAILLLTPSITKYPLLNAVLELLGTCLVIAGVMGRVFSGIFMGNNRDQRVVTTGIYACTRNPLYFFSFIATLGLTLAYGSLVILILFVVFFALYYSKVIAAEEKYLTIKFKDSYINYKNSTPRFFPNFKLFKVENEYITTNYKSILKTILDSSLILVITILIITIKDINPVKNWFYIW